jgi:hypothetical protein
MTNILISTYMTDFNKIRDKLVNVRLVCIPLGIVLIPS